MTSTGTPTWCGELELSEPRATTIDVPGPLEYRAARLLLRIHGEPVGYLRVQLAGTTVDVSEAFRSLDGPTRQRIVDHLLQEGLAVPAPLATEPAPAATAACPLAVAAGPLVSVVVCTRERPEMLRACLRGLAALTYPRLEVVIVDNAPTDDRTESLVIGVAAGDARFRYVREPRPGLSYARNRGAAEARGDVIAFTDDDVTVDPGWIDGVVRGFSRSPDVGCVTGLVCSASLTGAAEAYFDARVTWSVACAPRTFALNERADSVLHPYSPGIFGTGANFSFSRQALDAMGPFDVALGAGTPAAGGEDLDAFVRVLQAGYRIAYEPAALVWHHHRVGLEDLRQQMVAYGSGLTAFLTKHLLDRSTRGQVLRRVPPGVLRLVRIPAGTRGKMDSGTPVPKGLLAAELKGMLRGPGLYLRTRRRSTDA